LLRGFSHNSALYPEGQGRELIATNCNRRIINSLKKSASQFAVPVNLLNLLNLLLHRSTMNYWTINLVTAAQCNCQQAGAMRIPITLDLSHNVRTRVTDSMKPVSLPHMLRHYRARLLHLEFFWLGVLRSADNIGAQTTSVLDHFSWGAVPSTVQAGGRRMMIARINPLSAFHKA
jgi:hypothetical protein